MSEGDRMHGGCVKKGMERTKRPLTRYFNRSFREYQLNKVAVNFADATAKVDEERKRIGSIHVDEFFLKKTPLRFWKHSGT